LACAESEGSTASMVEEAGGGVVWGRVMLGRPKKLKMKNRSTFFLIRSVLSAT
jgi:hypothetical protein